MRPLAIASLIALAGVGCAAGDPPRQDAGNDAQMVWPDSGVDASSGEDAGSMGDDAGPPDEDAGAETDGGSTGSDAGVDGGSTGTDAGRDGGTTGCGSISAGDTLSLDGTGDLSMYPTEQILAPGAPVGAGDQVGITWDPDYLYLTFVSGALASDAFKPLHVYVEAASGTLPAATPGSGKEYGGLAPEFAFSPTHVIATRRTSDSGSGGPYNGVYEAASSWATRETPLTAGADYWVRSDGGAISVRVSWMDLGCPSRIRLSAHVVNQDVGNEWKDLVPAGAQPWNPTDGPGSYYELDLSGDPAIAGWTEVTP